MKTLILVRHAKSSWANPDTDDFDRPLNKRGEHDAPFMGKLIFEKAGKPDLIYSSPANRALSTARYFATEIGYSADEISQQKLIYQQGGRAIIKLLMSTPNEHNLIMLFGHNPDITSLANYFSDVNIDHMPTCSVACIDFDTDDWSWISDSNGKLRFFEYPKKYYS
jgi:phosphohistidine phosphatase